MVCYILLMPTKIIEFVKIGVLIVMLKHELFLNELKLDSNQSIIFLLYSRYSAR